jgi:hypothetical protein
MCSEKDGVISGGIETRKKVIVLPLSKLFG